MEKIKPPDSFHVDAAEGWMELGNAAEARAELALISARAQNHIRVLEIRWAIAASENDWSAAFDIARQTAQAHPKQPFGFIHQAYAMRRKAGGGLPAAWDILFPAMEIFPDEYLIPYNLACYACQMDQPDKARILLARAITLGKKHPVKQMALRDTDLKMLWPEIEAM